MADGISDRYIELLIGENTTVDNSTVVNSTWEGILNRKFPKEETKQQLQPFEVHLAQEIYSEQSAENPHIDLDSIVLQVVEKRFEQSRHDYQQRIRGVAEIVKQKSVPSGLEIRIPHEDTSTACCITKPLLLMVSFNDQNLFRIILENEISDAIDALFSACQVGHADIVKILLEKSCCAELWTKDVMGHALSICAANNCIAGLQALYTHANEGQGFLSLCRGPRFTPEAQQHRYLANALHTSIKHGQVEAVQWFLKRSESLITRFELEYCMKVAMDISQINVTIAMLHSKPFLMESFRSYPNAEVTKRQVLFDYLNLKIPAVKWTKGQNIS